MLFYSVIPWRAYISVVLASQSPEIQALVLLDGAANMPEHQRSLIEPGLERLSKQFDTQEQYITEIAKDYHDFGIETTDRLRSYLLMRLKKMGIIVNI